MNINIEEVSNEELDKIELDSFRGREKARAELEGFSQNLSVIVNERLRRQKLPQPQEDETE